MRLSFFLYFRETMKKRSHLPGGQSTPRLYNRYNLCPCARPAHVGRLWAGARIQILQNSASRMVVLRFTTLSVVACFPQANRLLPAATAADSKHPPSPFVCARPSDPRKQSRKLAPRAWPLILPSKPSITFWNSLWRDQVGAETWTQT